MSQRVKANQPRRKPSINAEARELLLVVTRSQLEDLVRAYVQFKQREKKRLPSTWPTVVRGFMEWLEKTITPVGKDWKDREEV